MLCQIQRLRTIPTTQKFIEDQIVLWFYKIVQAVAKLHQNNILHKRIKLGWILFKNADIKLAINSKSLILDNESETKDKYAKEIFSYNSPEYCESQDIGFKYDIWLILFN